MTTFVFPGQGSQFSGMSKDFYDNFKIARTTFEEIEDYVGINLKKIIFDDNNELLNITNYTQISIFTASLSIFKTLESEKNLKMNNINAMLGHSLGEYTALACSKKLKLRDCSLLLKKRGELMNNAIEPNKTGMAAIIGTDAKTIEDIINKNDINLEIANDNSPIQVVVSGDTNEINDKKELFINNKVKKYIELNVSAAFHSKYMTDAENELNELIENLEFTYNDIKIISNYNAQVSSDNSLIKQSLKKQMSNRVRWTESIKKLEKINEKKIIEIGPGSVLSGLIKRISNNFDIKNVNKISDILINYD